jgi:hypothetical protein
LIHVQEKDFRHDLGVVEIWHSKTDEPRFVPFLPEDMELARSFGPALPHLYFFRHVKGNGPTQPGSPFGPKYFYKWWEKACLNLGIEGVDLYGGTRHSSTRALREFRTPEEIKRATMHSTNKAFERYFQIELDDVRGVYVDTVLTLKKGKGNKGKLLKLKE